MAVNIGEVMGGAVVLLLGVVLLTSLVSVFNTSTISVDTEAEWSQGVFDGTETDGNEIQLAGANTSGTYNQTHNVGPTSWANYTTVATVPSGAEVNATVETESGSSTFTVSDGSNSFDISGLSSTQTVTVIYDLNANATGASPEVGSYTLEGTDNSSSSVFVELLPLLFVILGIAFIIDGVV